MRSYGVEPPHYLEQHEKNWCPFIVPSNLTYIHAQAKSSASPSSLYLIKFVKPLEVVQILPQDNTRCEAYLTTMVAMSVRSSVMSVCVSVCRAEYEEIHLSVANRSHGLLAGVLPVPSIQWDYGELRGGTAAHLVRPDLYLAFFHSKWTLPGSRLISYFFGAYAFDTRPPFRLKAVSR